MNQIPLVSICCITYNQEAFIEETIKGFLLQQVSFPIEIIIHDDASTDGTANIVRRYEEKYPDIFRPIYQTENQWRKGVKPSHAFVWPAARGKYIALCEGDDYWIDPLKLERQVAFMEQHPECSISTHNSFVRKADGTQFVYNQESKYTSDGADHIYSIRDLIPHLFYHTSSMLMRRSCIWPLPAWVSKAFAGDYFVSLTLAGRGDIHFCNTVSSVYRVNETSVSNYHSRQNILKDFERHLETFDEETRHQYRSEIDLKLSDMRFSLYYYHPNYFKKLGFVFRNLGRIFRKDGFRQGYFSRLKLLIPSQLLRGWSNPLVANKK